MQVTSWESFVDIYFPFFSLVETMRNLVDGTKTFRAFPILCHPPTKTWYASRVEENVDVVRVRRFDAET